MRGPGGLHTWVVCEFWNEIDTLSFPSFPADRRRRRSIWWCFLPCTRVRNHDMQKERVLSSTIRVLCFVILWSQLLGWVCVEGWGEGSSNLHNIEYPTLRIRNLANLSEPNCVNRHLGFGKSTCPGPGEGKRNGAVRWFSYIYGIKWNIIIVHFGKISGLGREFLVGEISWATFALWKSPHIMGGRHDGERWSHKQN